MIRSTKIYKTGIILTTLRTAMFFIGAIGWVYTIANPIVLNIERYSFYFWLPVVVIGVAFLTWPQKRK